MAINFISAKDGGLAMYEVDAVLDDGPAFGRYDWANTVDGVADILLDRGIAASVMRSSSMDFARCWGGGFDTDDGAMHLYKRALERAGI